MKAGNLRRIMFGAALAAAGAMAAVLVPAAAQEAKPSGATSQPTVSEAAEGASSVASPVASAFDWPQWRGPNHDGISAEKDWSWNWPKEGPKVLWKKSVGMGYSAVAVSRGRVYTMGAAGDTETVYCFNADSGDLVWRQSYTSKAVEHPGPRCTPTVEDNRVYTLSPAGIANCFDAEKGNVIWTKKLAEELGNKPPRWGFAGSPLIDGKLVILNVNRAGVALDKMRGDVVWKTENQTSGYATPVLYKSGPAVNLAMFSGKGIAGVSASDGVAQWWLPWTTSYDVNAADPIVSGDKVFISSGYDKGCALLQLAGREPKVLWQNKAIRAHFSNPVLIDGYLYASDGNSAGDCNIVCVDFNKGDVKWSHKGYGMVSLMAAGDKLVVMGEKGDLLVLEATPTEYKELAHAKVLEGVCWTMPVLSNGRIYCRNDKGDLVCLDVRAAKPKMLRG